MQLKSPPTRASVVHAGAEEQEKQGVPCRSHADMFDDAAVEGDLAERRQ